MFFYFYVKLKEEVIIEELIYGSRFMFLDDKRVQDYHWFNFYAELPDVVKIKGINYKKTKEKSQIKTNS